MRRCASGILADALDVFLSGLAAGDVLAFDGGRWENQTLSAAGIAASTHGHSAATVSSDGFMAAADKTKLDGIESGATADMTANEILTALLGVDGTGSGLDADKLDGNEASAFATSGHNHNSDYLALAGGVLTGSLELNNILPCLILNETDQALDAKKWWLLTHNSEVVFQARKDDDTYLLNAMYLDRSGNIRIAGNITCGASKTLCSNLNADQVDGYEATDFVAKSLYDANTVLYATTDNTPAALTVNASTVVGRAATGNIVALTATQLRMIINVEDGATADMSASEILTALLTVDGAGCLLDADLLDGNEASAFALSGHNHSTTYVALAGGTMTGNLTISAAGPTIKWNETDQADDSKLWAAFPYSANWYLQSQTDAGAAVSNILKIGRTGLVTFGGADSALIFTTSVTPTLSTDQAALYCADQTSGNRCIHAKSEAGNVVKLFTGAAVADATDATSTMARLNDLLARMRANGLIAT